MTLSPPQSSNGQIRSRPFPARPVKIMESAGHTRTTEGCAAQPISALEKEKAPAGTNAESPVDGHAARFQTVAALVRSEITRADWTERQSRVADFMVTATLDRGRQEVKGINLEELGGLLGISKGNVSDVFYELQLCGFLQVIDSPLAGKVYRVLPASEHWSVQWRYQRAALESYLLALDVASGHAQNELFDPEPDLKASIAETQLESVLQVSPKVSSLPSSTSNRVIRDNNLEVSNKSNFEGISSDFSGGEKPVNKFPVPESGTSPKSTGREWYEVYNESMKRNWADDGYLYEKLRLKTSLFEELWEGKTRMAREFCLLFQRAPQRAKELAAIAVQRDYPAKWLNTSVSNELLGKEWHK